MTYDKIKELITINKCIILESLDKDMEGLKEEYISDIKDDWIAESSIGSFSRAFLKTPMTCTI